MRNRYGWVLMAYFSYPGYQHRLSMPNEWDIEEYRMAARIKFMSIPRAGMSHPEVIRGSVDPLVLPCIV